MNMPAWAFIIYAVGSAVVPSATANLSAAQCKTMLSLTETANTYNGKTRIIAACVSPDGQHYLATKDMAFVVLPK